MTELLNWFKANESGNEETKIKKIVDILSTKPFTAEIVTAINNWRETIKKKGIYFYQHCVT